MLQYKIDKYIYTKTVNTTHTEVQVYMQFSSRPVTSVAYITGQDFVYDSSTVCTYVDITYAAIWENITKTIELLKLKSIT